MKTSIASLTFILTIALYGITPATAEPFNDKGPAIIGPVASSSATPSAYVAQLPNGFNDEVNYESPGSSTRRAGTLLGKHCDLQPLSGFNDVSPTATC
jgi:hypothetical protein